MTMTTSKIKHFTAGDNLMNTLTMRQTGSPEKGIAELVMNGFDADRINGKKVEINIRIDTKGFSVSDNGEGFLSEEEVMLYFKRIGFDHTIGKHADKDRFGQHGIGRFQIQSHAKCSWRTNSFEMSVDALEQSDSFLFSRNLPHQAGCTVSGEWYIAKSNHDIDAIALGLCKLVKYMLADVYVNGNLVTTDLNDYDVETDDFLIKYTELHDTVNIYNKGVFVESVNDASLFGCILVSKTKMNLNTARDGIIKRNSSSGQACKVWSEAYTLLRNKVNENIFTKPSNSFTKKDTYALLNSILNGDFNKATTEQLQLILTKELLFTSGEKKSIRDIFHYSPQFVICDTTAFKMPEYRSLNASGEVTLIDKSTLLQTSVRSFEDLYQRLYAALSKADESYYSHNYRGRDAYKPQQIRVLSHDVVKRLIDEVKEQRSVTVKNLPLSPLAKISKRYISDILPVTVSDMDYEQAYIIGSHAGLLLGEKKLEHFVQTALTSAFELKILAFAAESKIESNLPDDAPEYERFTEQALRNYSFSKASSALIAMQGQLSRGNVPNVKR